MHRESFCKYSQGDLTEEVFFLECFVLSAIASMTWHYSTEANSSKAHVTLDQNLDHIFVITPIMEGSY